LLPSWIAAIAIAILSFAGLIEPLEQLCYQGLFWLRGELPWDNRVVVVQIDDRTLAAVGSLPLQRGIYAQLLQVMRKAEGSVVGFDLIWSEATNQDPSLADAIANHGRVVLATAQDSQRSLLQPVPALAQGASDVGHIQAQVDADGLSRYVPAFVKTQPTFAIALLSTQALSGDAIALPQANQLLWLNWLRSSSTIPSYSLVDVIRQKVPAEAFRDKIVLVGVTATGWDKLLTPFNRNQPTSGVYLHATLVTNLLQGNLLHLPSWGWRLAALVLLGSGVSLWRDRASTMAQIGIGLGLAIGWVGIALLALRFSATWLPIAAALLLLLTVVTVNLLLERLSLNAVLQRQVQELWQRYYSDLVLRHEPQLVTQQLATRPVSMQRAKQLATLAEQFGRSHAAQAAIARNLSLGLLASDLDGFIWFCNPIAAMHLGAQVGTPLQSHLVPDWVSGARWQQIYKGQFQQIEVTQGDRWFALTFEPLFYQPNDTAPSGLLLILEDITERQQSTIALQQYADKQADLNQRLTERTTQLELVNQELETFSFAVSHDLRAPLRRIKGFSEVLLEDQGDQLGEEGKRYLHFIQSSVQRMGVLVEDLLNLSRLIRSEMSIERVNLSQMASEIMAELQDSSREVQVTIQPKLWVQADKRLLRVALENLLSNAWKYTSQRSLAQIELGLLPEGNVFFVRDNGAGFEMSQANRLFSAFQRLHNQDEFPGNGIGLMTTRRIFDRHHGQIWAEAAVDQGATFYFTLSPNAGEKQTLN
jgi:signal transduction histidine kinase